MKKLVNNNDTHCCECGRLLNPSEDTYKDRLHETLCQDCLLMLHKKHR